MNNVKKKMIGVLGGMGHASTAHSFNLLVEYQQLKLGCVQDEDFYKSVIYNTAMTEWDNTGFVDTESVKKQLVEEIKKLQGIGCEIVGIPCNTVHLFYKEMQDLINIPIVNMIEETAKRVIQSGIKAVGIICSRSTREYGIYEKYLPGIEVIYSAHQNLIDEVILNVQAGDMPVKTIQL